MESKDSLPRLKVLPLAHERLIPATLFHHVSFLSSVLILPSFMLRFSYLTSVRFLNQKTVCTFFLTSMCHKPCHLILLRFIVFKIFGENFKFSLCILCPASCYFLPQVTISPAPLPWIPSTCVLPGVMSTKFHVHTKQAAII